MKLNIRRLKETDWDTLENWWSFHFNTIPNKESFPDNGIGGIIVENNNIPVCMCFIYSTNSKVAFLEWILSNPEYKEDDRSELIDIMLVAAEKIIKQQGYKYIFGFTTKKRLAERLEKLGHIITNENSYEVVKSLN
jgi:hypothetical protein